MTDIVVYGRGKTGVALADLARKQGLSVDFYSDGDNVDLQQVFDCKEVWLSPGVPPNAKGLAFCKQNGVVVRSELSVCFPLCKGQVVSVTGTNGKTTVCGMVKHILDKCGQSCLLLGNGGVPFAKHVVDVKQNEIVVLESSSFQLLSAQNFAPHLSVFTSLAPDHLDYHGSFVSYVLAKCNNFLWQRPTDFALFNADNKQLLRLARHSKARVLTYSVSSQDSDCFVKDGFVYINQQGKLHRCKQSFPSQLPHNRSNALAAILACVCLGVDFCQAVAAVGDYVLLPHRNQLVGMYNGVAFVDDSKGTNVEATLHAIRCYDGQIALIVGGSDKGEDFWPLFASLPSNVVFVAAVGQTACKMVSMARRRNVNAQVFDNYVAAVKACYNSVVCGGGTVLLSNACASFDMFGGFGERGDHFQNIVKELFL